MTDSERSSLKEQMNKVREARNLLMEARTSASELDYEIENSLRAAELSSEVAWGLIENRLDIDNLA